MTTTNVLQAFGVSKEPGQYRHMFTILALILWKTQSLVTLLVKPARKIITANWARLLRPLVQSSRIQLTPDYLMQIPANLVLQAFTVQKTPLLHILHHFKLR